MKFDLPESLGDALRNPKKFRDMLQMLRTLQRLRVYNGSGREGYIQFSERDAVINLVSSSGGSSVPPDGEDLHPETILWRDRILAAGGAVNAASIALADALIRRINRQAWNSKIVYLLPYLGQDLIAARVPLRDQLGVGIADSSGFVDADFREDRGLQGDGLAKYLDIKFAPDDLEEQLGSVRKIGFGWWDTRLQDTFAANRYIMGSFDGTGQTIMRASAAGLVDFQSGNYLGPFVDITTDRMKGHYYGQRTASNDRKGYIDGALFEAEATSESGGISAQHIALFAFRDTPANGGVREFYAGRSAVAYVTTGDLDDSEAAAVHTLLDQYLITPLGRMDEDNIPYDGGSAADEFDTILNGGTAADEFTTILDGNPEV